MHGHAGEDTTMEEQRSSGGRLIAIVVAIAGLLALGLFASRRYESRNPSDFNYSYRVFTGEKGESVWIFDASFKPSFHLSTDPDYLPSVNRALEEIGLGHNVEEIVDVKSTNLTTGTQLYEWIDFPLGVLQVEVVECRGPDRSSYRCIGRVVLVNE